MGWSSIVGGCKCYHLTGKERVLFHRRFLLLHRRFLLLHCRFTTSMIGSILLDSRPSGRTLRKFGDCRTMEFVKKKKHEFLSNANKEVLQSHMGFLTFHNDDILHILPIYHP
ncbi:hypothetical protein ZOSMA_123G00800 [Zostera marina]|uniref:Uncharacterized protein n=1 Tax=Zostera marina TaxID=29655 RepID=A0A0K9Q0C2_ZOSMR|nr:hypothetical protein ZOSMA_123G00800 [Zostera marina]